MKTSLRMLALLALLLGLAAAPATFAQTLLSEDFTGTASSADSNTGVGNWLFFNGACLTAGTSTSLASPATSIPGCTTVLNSYYVNTQDHDTYLMGGANGYLGGTSAPSSPAGQQPDPDKSGALRFTNGRPFGNQQRGAIVSTNAYSTNAGIQVTFKTVTYGGTGADGISFYLMDGCVPVSGAAMPSDCSPPAIYPTGTANVPAIGATGGSLAYSCSNTNGPSSGTGVTYDGLTGGYLGLGIDEFGNFLNQGDNTGSGYGAHAGRIGLRGAGAISWPALNNAYGVNPNNPAKPFYPAYLNATCPAGTFDASNGTCNVCPAGPSGNTTSGGLRTVVATTTVYSGGMCNNTTTTTVTPVTAGCASSGYTYENFPSPTGPSCAKCSSSSATYYPTTDTDYPNGLCSKQAHSATSISCDSGYSYDSTVGYCAKAPVLSTNFSSTVSGAPTVTTATSSTPPSSQPPYTPNVSAIQTAMQKTCSSGHLWNYASATPTDAGPATLPTDPTSPNLGNTAGILDYAPIPNAYSTTLASNQLYNGSATTRDAATTIFYNLKITSDGFLSLSYAYGGGAYQSIISNRNIQASNGVIPKYVRFGFAGSTGGSTNVHEIMCFKSAPVVQSASSAGVNEKQSAKVEEGTFAYFAYYDQNNWVGRVTASLLSSDADTGVVSIADVPVWDASCVLTGVVSGQACNATKVPGPTNATDPASRLILTYNAANSGGVTFTKDKLSSDQLAALAVEAPPPATQSDANTAGYWINYMRGDRSNEVNSAGTCAGGSVICFRARTSILGDIVDSSPTWVGPPQSPYTATWQDKRYPAAAAPENSGTQNYLQYVAAAQTRPNVVYVGSNDGMMHGFRTGGFDTNGVFTTATTPNDGQEVIAYVPGSLLLSASTGGACASLAATGSIVQNIHGVTPSTTACLTTALDFSNPQYGHNFFVDATPGTGDLFYNNTWHTWLVGGLGAGGAAIFALDVTDPAHFATTAPANLVVGEWTAANITCVNSTPCKTSLGATYGTPIIRRLHDGKWAVIFGNGYGSASGDAGIYVMTVASDGSQQFYYLSTGTAGTNNGIAYVTSADLDGDHVTDYIYAGDLNGKLWRFDLTSKTETDWIASIPTALFQAPAGQPITTSVTVSSGATPAGASTVMIAFGTGMRTQFTNALGVQFKSTGALYGVWDWNMSDWNSKSSIQYASLAPPPVSGLASPYTLTTANLQVQTFVVNTADGTRDIPSPTNICWAGSPTCTTTPKLGWYVNLPPGEQEQIVYNPQLLQGIFTVNSIVPANNLVNACTTKTDAGFTYAISVLTGTAPPNFFVSYHDTQAAGVQTNAVGTSFPVTSSTGSLWLVSQTVTNQPILTQVNPGANGKGRRLTWVQLR